MYKLYVGIIFLSIQLIFVEQVNNNIEINYLSSKPLVNDDEIHMFYWSILADALLNGCRLS